MSSGTGSATSQYSSINFRGAQYQRIAARPEERERAFTRQLFSKARSQDTSSPFADPSRSRPSGGDREADMQDDKLRRGVRRAMRDRYRRGCKPSRVRPGRPTMKLLAAESLAPIPPTATRTLGLLRAVL